MRVIEATELNAQRKSSEASLATQSALLELNQLRGESPETHLSVARTQLGFRTAEDTGVLLALSLAQTTSSCVHERWNSHSKAFEWTWHAISASPLISIGPTFSEENSGASVSASSV